jgi:hypothetical protein
MVQQYNDKVFRTPSNTIVSQPYTVNPGKPPQQINPQTNQPIQFQHPILPAYQVNSHGSADPAYQKATQLSPNNSLYHETNPPPMNPIMDKFGDMIGDATFKQNLAKDGQMQASLFDVDNLVKSNAGIFRKQQPGVQEFGLDADGKPMYSLTDVTGNGASANNYKSGENQLSTVGQVLDSTGAFRTKEEASSFAKYTKLAGSPQFMGQLTAQISQGDQKGAVNSILTQFGKPTLDQYAKNPSDKAGIATAFSAYNMVTNWDKMSTSQRSLAMAGMALTGYQYANGEDLSKRVLIGGAQKGDPSLTVGTALGLAGAGVNVVTLMKNWDQMDMMQRLTFGAGTAAQMATTAKQMGLIGAAENGGKAVNTTAQALGSLGFKAAPSMGVGAVVGPSSNVPQGYTVVAAGTAPDTVVAVPIGHEGTAATMNGSSNLVSLNTLAGGAVAAAGAYSVYQNWGKGGSEGAINGVIGGTQMAQGIAKLGESNPYTLGAIVAASALGGVVKNKTASAAIGIGAGGYGAYAAYNAATAGANAAGSAASATLGNVAIGAGTAYSASKILGSNMSAKQKATALRRTAEDSAATYYTAGLYAVGQLADQKLFKGRGEKFREKYEKYATLGGSVIADKLTAGVLGGKSSARMGRDMVRKGVQDAGIVDKQWNVTLADGTKVNAGLDGKDGNHEFRDPSKVPQGNEVRTLSAYDVDYTNDLDFSANLMTTSLMRLLSGGKGKAIDQISGQLANASLGNVGYGQDMTQETFGKAQANVRGMFVQSGLKTKEDAYALANQAFAEHRINEMDLAQLHQGINMTFDQDGYDTAHQLMPGRYKGIEVASSMVNTPGPHMVFQQTPSLPRNPDPGMILSGGVNPLSRLTPDQKVGVATQVAAGQAVSNTQSPAYSFNMEGGHYWGQPTAGLYQQALQDYVDPWSKNVPITGMNLKGVNTRDMSKADLRKFNASRYA